MLYKDFNCAFRKVTIYIFLFPFESKCIGNEGETETIPEGTYLKDQNAPLYSNEVKIKKKRFLHEFLEFIVCVLNA